jgi:hypothetical protein
MSLNQIGMFIVCLISSPFAFGDWGQTEDVGYRYEVVLNQSIELDNHTYYDDVSYFTNSADTVYKGSLISEQEYNKVVDKKSMTCYVTITWHEKDVESFSAGKVIGVVDWDISKKNLDIKHGFSFDVSREVAVQTSPSGEHNYIIMGCWYENASVLTPKISDAQFIEAFKDILEIRKIK